MTTIVLAEDHQILRQGLKMMLGAEKAFRLVGEAGDGLEAVRIVKATKPNVLVLDLMIPHLHGLEVTRQLSKDCPRTKIVILSMHADEPYVVEALRSGALGYVLKECTAANLIEAIQSVASGKRYLSPALAERALAAFFQNPSEPGLDPYETLTER